MIWERVKVALHRYLEEHRVTCEIGQQSVKTIIVHDETSSKKEKESIK
jgi:hypothetical protein